MDRMDRRVVCAAAGAVVGVVLTPVVVPGLVGLLGFGAAGPVATSFAAAWQASIGNVAAGSVFAVAQSIGMGGAIPTGISVITAGIGAAMGAAAGGGQDNPGGEDDADAGTAGEDGLGPAAGSSASSKSGASAASEDGARPAAGGSTAGASNADGNGADADPDDPTPVGVGVPRTGLDRCDRCKRKHKRDCWHR